MATRMFRYSHGVRLTGQAHLAHLVLVWDDTYYSTLYMAREPALAETNGASGGGAARSAC
jgi:hypothetical protein